jgi:hypothetical protein
MDMSARNMLFVILFGSDVLGNQENLFHSIQLSPRQVLPDSLQFIADFNGDNNSGYL